MLINRLIIYDSYHIIIYGFQIQWKRLYIGVSKRSGAAIKWDPHFFEYNYFHVLGCKLFFNYMYWILSMTKRQNTTYPL